MTHVININTPKELITEYQHALKHKEHVDNSLDKLTLATKRITDDIAINVTLHNMFTAFIRICVHDIKHNIYAEEDLDTLVGTTTITYKNDVYQINLNQEQPETNTMTAELIKVPSPEVMDKAIEVYGKEYQIDRFLEECNELCKALLKRRRTDLPEERFDTTKINSNVQEEIGDVLITLAQVIKIHGNPELIKASMAMKINRLRNQLTNDGHLKP